ncbi:MAG: response regulator transcription factor, partial [Sneathiellales bacterium]|nr:response regulator transcription factor [Sneathiellales bacterium]
SVAAGSRVIHPDVQSALDQANKSDLTKRELQILHAIARGETNPIIAEKLGISPKTVDSHRTSIMKKMETHTVAELLTKALKAGFIGEES